MNLRNNVSNLKRYVNHSSAALLIQFIYLIGCTETTSPDIGSVLNSAKLSAEYLIRCVDENGMFRYRINMDTTIKLEPKYSILRHAGTIYAMCMYYQLNPDPAMKSAIETAGRYLRDESINPISGEKNMLAVWSKPEVDQSGKPLQAKLGGAGLGLIALLSVEKIHPGFIPLSALQALGRFIVLMQKNDGSFNSLYIPSMGGAMDDWQSLYYPGEAALGLLMLYEIDSLDVWIQSAAKSLEYLALGRRNSKVIPADHWELLAIEKILSLEAKKEIPVSRELLINHAIQISVAILHDQIKDPDQPSIDGGFSEDGRTTYTATRLEGLLSVLNFLPHEHELKTSIEESVRSGISFLQRSQIKKGEFSGAIPRAVGKMDQDIILGDQFNHRTTEVRIDYVQHALSAMIRYVRLNYED